jgi:hypothetical protein
MNPRTGWGQPPTGWGQPHQFPGWAPLVDPGPRPLQAARSVGRWLWPALAVSGFLAVAAYTFAHDDPAPGLSHRGLLTVALAAVVVVLLTIHRRYGSRSLARALTEYTVVALLSTLLAATGGAAVDQQPTDRPTRAQAQTQAAAGADQAAAGADQPAAGADQPALLRAGAKLVRSVTGAARALAGAVRWLVDLWRRADQHATPPNDEAMAASLCSPAPSAIFPRRSP